MMVGAFVFAKLAMVAVFGLFLNGVASILGGLTKASGDWWGNLMIIIGAIWVTIVFAEQIISQSMGIIFQVPDKVFAWIGQSFGSNVGSDMGAQVSRDAEGGFGRAGGSAGQMAQAGQSGVTQAVNSNSHGARAKAADDADNADYKRELRQESRSKKPGGGGGGTVSGGGKIGGKG